MNEELLKFYSDTGFEDALSLLETSEKHKILRKMKLQAYHLMKMKLYKSACCLSYMPVLQIVGTH
jgi:hypothetical protein